MVAPQGWSGMNGLVSIIYRNGIVGERAYKIFVPFSMSVIRISSGVNQKWIAIDVYDH